MDRERLLRYIDREYLPKRDVLSHIPLGASLDDVWEEAQRERRKKATLLSPMRGSGAAPWFVLTDSGSSRYLTVFFPTPSSLLPRAVYV